MRLLSVFVLFFLSSCSFFSSKSSPKTGGISEPVIEEFIRLAEENCQKFSRVNRVRFAYNQAVKHIQYSNHDYDYYVIDGRHLECDDCPSCYHTDYGYDVKVFVRLKSGPLLLGFNRIVIDYKLIDPTDKESPAILKVIVRGNPKTQKDAIYLKFDGQAYQAVSRDPDVK